MRPRSYFACFLEPRAEMAVESRTTRARPRSGHERQTRAREGLAGPSVPSTSTRSSRAGRARCPLVERELNGAMVLRAHIRRQRTA
jgi:hypothetical protein